MNLTNSFFLSYKMGRRKPEPMIFQAVFEMSQLSPAKHIFIDDKEEFVSVARSLGMRGIVFKSDGQLKTELMKNGIAVNIL